MAFSFKLDADVPRDLDIQGGKIQTVSDNDLLVQKIQTVWSTNRGEWSLNKNEGIDLYGTVLVKNPDEDLIRDDLEAALEKIEPDAKIVELSLDVDADRSAVIKAKIKIGDSQLSVVTDLE